MRCLVVLAAALAASASPVTAATAQQPSRSRVEGLERQILVELNQARAGRGLEPLRPRQACASRRSLTRGRCSPSGSSTTHLPTARASITPGFELPRSRVEHLVGRRDAARHLGRPRRAPDRRGVVAVEAPSRGHPLRDLAGRRHRSAVCDLRSAGVPRSADHGRHRRLRPAGGERAGRWGELRRERTEGCSLGIDLDRVAAIQGHPDEAADVDVLDDAAIARAETESSSASRTSSILVPTDTPARMRAARRRAPMGSIGRLSAATADVLTLQRGLRAGEQLARRSRGLSAGRSNSTARVGPPASTHPRKESA